MIMPTKTTKVIDSLISISAIILEILQSKSMTIDDLQEEFNNRYCKEISIDKLILCIDFLYLINKIEDNNEVIKININ